MIQQTNITILRRSSVLELTGLTKSTIYRLMELGQFPRPVRLSTRAVGWRKAEVLEWLASREKTHGDNEGL